MPQNCQSVLSLNGIILGHIFFVLDNRNGAWEWDCSFVSTKAETVPKITENVLLSSLLTYLHGWCVYFFVFVFFFCWVLDDYVCSSLFFYICVYVLLCVYDCHRDKTRQSTKKMIYFHFIIILFIRKRKGKHDRE